MQAWKNYLSPRYLVFYCGLAGLLIPFWVMQNYAASGDHRALIIVLLIVIGFTLGIHEQWQHATAIGSVRTELLGIDANRPPHTLLNELSYDSRFLLESRLDPSGGGAGGVAAGRTLFTPYLIGALVMLGLIGTFLGLVDTLGGTRTALQTTADVDALRNSLLAPIAGLARAFGTSVSGVATSVLLGLASTLTRREEVRAALLADTIASGPLQALNPAVRQAQAVERLLDQGSILQPVIARFNDAIDAVLTTQNEARKSQEHLAHQIANVLGARLDAICNELGASVKRFGDDVEPAVGRVMQQATGFLDSAGRDLLAKVEASVSQSEALDQERRQELVKMFEAERQQRTQQEVEHFERLTGHAKSLTESLQTHVEAVSRQYAQFLGRIEQQASGFDQAWRHDVEGRRKEGENQRRLFDEHLESVRYKFAEQSEVLARRHQEVLDRLNQQYQDTVERFSKQSSVFAEHASKTLGEMSVKYAQIVDQHEDDRQKLRMAWGSEQGRQQRQFDAMLEKMRQDLDDRRRADMDLLASLSAWAQQMTKRIEGNVEDKALSWDSQFQKLIAALNETADAMRLGDRARIKEFKEIVQVVSEADRNRADELRELIMTLRQNGSRSG